MPPDPRSQDAPPDVRAPLGFAYLFERFPSFSQTFCFREVSEMLALGLEFPVFSIRSPKDEPDQVFPPELSRVTRVLPQDFDAMIRQDPRGFGRQALQHQKILVEEWGNESDRKRIYEALWLAPVLRAAGVRHVHAHFAGMAARTAYWLKRFAGVTFSFTAHANDVFVDEPKARLPELFAAAEFVATETDFSVRFIQEKFPAHAAKIHRVYNGIDAGRFAGLRHPDAPPLILSVGRYIEKKGFLDLIDACAALGDLPFHCLLVGQGPMEDEMRGRIARHNLQGKVEVAGTRNETEIAALLARSSVFALACVKAGDGGSDNLPTVIMEAMAAGVPVVSTATAGVPEMVLDGVTGRLVSERSPDALARAIREILENPAAGAQMGAAARERCRERFDIRRTTETLRNLLRDHGALRG